MAAFLLLFFCELKKLYLCIEKQMIYNFKF
jgi:hypothetical protein